MWGEARVRGQEAASGVARMLYQSRGRLLYKDSSTVDWRCQEVVADGEIVAFGKFADV
jgi:hypothetical protein